MEKAGRIARRWLVTTQRTIAIDRIVASQSRRKRSLQIDNVAHDFATALLRIWRADPALDVQQQIFGQFAVRDARIIIHPTPSRHDQVATHIELHDHFFRAHRTVAELHTVARYARRRHPSARPLCASIVQLAIFPLAILMQKFARRASVQSWPRCHQPMDMHALHQLLHTTIDPAQQSIFFYTQQTAFATALRSFLFASPWWRGGPLNRQDLLSNIASQFAPKST